MKGRLAETGTIERFFDGGSMTLTPHTKSLGLPGGVCQDEPSYIIGKCSGGQGPEPGKQNLDALNRDA